VEDFSNKPDIPCCHICLSIYVDDCVCVGCERPVCYDHMVEYTIHNQIDCCLCKSCHPEAFYPSVKTITKIENLCEIFKQGLW
jgi:hypothetical protein